MGDLYSKNYNQTFQMKSFLNPIKLVFLIESILMKNYENLCFDSFYKTLLFSKKEIRSIQTNKKKILQINFGIEEIVNKFKFNENKRKSRCRKFESFLFHGFRCEFLFFFTSCSSAFFKCI